MKHIVNISFDDEISGLFINTEDPDFQKAILDYSTIFGEYDERDMIEFMRDDLADAMISSVLDESSEFISNVISEGHRGYDEYGDQEILEEWFSYHSGDFLSSVDKFGKEFVKLIPEYSIKNNSAILKLEINNNDSHSKKVLILSSYFDFITSDAIKYLYPNYRIKVVLKDSIHTSISLSNSGELLAKLENSNTILMLKSSAINENDAFIPILIEKIKSIELTIEQ